MILFCFFNILSPLLFQGPQVLPCLSTTEMELYEKIMQYRAKKKLPEITLSAALTKVAQIHAQDLQNHQPSKGKCNLHSWSDQGSWSDCCYTSDHKRAKCMWDKPRELTDYKGDGYEIAHWSSAGATAESAFEGWKDSPGHNAVMVNRDIWSKVNWQAIGIGVVGEYAVVWFGKEMDTLEKPELCP